MRGLIIINPSSGTQTVQKSALRIISNLLLDNDSDGVFIAYTHEKDDARRITAALRRNEYDYVLAVGGDGTVNEVITGLYQSGSDIPIAILPAGTTNDFASSIGLPRSVQSVCDMIKALNTVYIDIGRFNDTYFFNVAAGGALSEVAHSVSSDLKTVFGRLAYLVEGAKKISNMNFATTPLTFEMDGVRENLDVFFFIVANSTSVGGFGNIAPLAKVNDGLLDVCIVKRVDALTALPVLTQIQAGTHLRNSRQIVYRQVRKLRVLVPYGDDTEFPLDYDGEDGGRRLPLEIETIHNAVRIIIPPNVGQVSRVFINDEDLKALPDIKAISGDIYTNENV